MRKSSYAAYAETYEEFRKWLCSYNRLKYMTYSEEIHDFTGNYLNSGKIMQDYKPKLYGIPP